MEEWKEEACLSGTSPSGKGELVLHKVVPSAAPGEGDAAWGPLAASG